MAQAATGFLVTPDYATRQMGIQIPSPVRLEGIRDIPDNKKAEFRKLIELSFEQQKVEKLRDQLMELVAKYASLKETQVMAAAASAPSPSEGIDVLMESPVVVGHTHLEPATRTIAVIAGKKSELQKSLGVREVVILSAQGK